MVKARKFVVINKFQSVPKREDFDLVEYDLPPLKDNDILVKSEWLSMDPYLRGYNHLLPVPYDQFGFNVGVVEDSKDPAYPVGTKIVSHVGWCDRYVINTKETRTGFDKIYKLPDLKGLSSSLGCGTVGMTGVTAYFGFLDYCLPKPGETVAVTGAAGAVGSIVGQIAKIKGCRVIGFAGSDDKVQWLEKELGFDKVLNYKNNDVQKALKEAAPEGIDCFFDNVGGELSSIIVNQMNQFGRVSLCGSISSYSDNFMDYKTLPKISIWQPAIVSNQLKIQGFTARPWIDRFPEAFVELIKWLKSGELKAPEHITEGLENAVDALVGMLTGDNFGKAVVKV